MFSTKIEALECPLICVIYYLEHVSGLFQIRKPDLKIFCMLTKVVINMIFVNLGFLKKNSHTLDARSNILNKIFKYYRKNIRFLS